MPGLVRVLALVDPKDPSTPKLWKQTQAAAGKLGLDLVVRKADNARRSREGVRVAAAR